VRTLTGRLGTGSRSSRKDLVGVLKNYATKATKREKGTNRNTIKAQRVAGGGGPGRRKKEYRRELENVIVPYY